MLSLESSFPVNKSPSVNKFFSWRLCKSPARPWRGVLGLREPWLRFHDFLYKFCGDICTILIIIDFESDFCKQCVLILIKIYSLCLFDGSHDTVLGYRVRKIVDDLLKLINFVYVELRFPETQFQVLPLTNHFVQMT